MVHRCCSWVVLLNCFCPLAACTVLSGITEAKPQEEAVVSSGVFSNRGPPSAPEKQPRATPMVYIVWGVTSTSLTSCLKGVFLCLILAFSQSMVLVGNIVNPSSSDHFHMLLHTGMQTHISICVVYNFR